MKVGRRLGILATVLLGLGCGGGGGGGADSGGAIGVRLLHGSLSSPPVDLVVDGNSQGDGEAGSFRTGRFGETSGYLSVDPGAHLLQLREHLSPTSVVATVPLQYRDGERYSVLLFGGGKAKVVSDEAPSLQEGEGGVRVANAIIDGSPVSLVIDGGTAGTADAGVVSRYAGVPLGTHTAEVRTASGASLFTTPLEVAEGQVFTLVVAGERGLFITGRLF